MKTVVNARRMNNRSFTTKDYEAILRRAALFANLEIRVFPYVGQGVAPAEVRSERFLTMNADLFGELDFILEPSP